LNTVTLSYTFFNRDEKPLSAEIHNRG
jgi:cytochrome c oxidase assembly protein Cox11